MKRKKKVLELKCVTSNQTGLSVKKLVRCER